MHGAAQGTFESLALRAQRAREKMHVDIPVCQKRSH